MCSAQLAFQTEQADILRPPLRQQHVTLACTSAACVLHPLPPGQRQSCLGFGSCLLACCCCCCCCCRRRSPSAARRSPYNFTTGLHRRAVHHHQHQPPPPFPLPLKPRPAFILACLPACLHTHAPSPSASASALRSISTACSFPHRPCPALVQGFFSLSLYRALRCDHPLTHLLSPYTPAATFYPPPPAMRAACT